MLLIRVLEQQPINQKEACDGTILWN
jgi:hypothetical protein